MSETELLKYFMKLYDKSYLIIAYIDCQAHVTLCY